VCARCIAAEHCVVSNMSADDSRLGEFMIIQSYRHQLVSILASTILLTACAHVPAPPGAGGEPSMLVLSDCTVPNLDEQALCGGLDVFENRDARTGRIIRLRIAVLPARGGALRPDPVFVIVGGPGQSAVDNAAGYAALLAPLRTDRALVFVDQRGTGGSNPLPCDLYSAQASGPLGDFMPLDAVRACRKVLELAADLRYYSSELAADDLDDVRGALGYEQINIEAASYGTRVALLYLRRNSAHVRSAVLRSVSPPWVKQPLHFAEDAQAAFDSLAAACDAERSCRSAFPRFREEMHSVLAQLEAENVLVELPATDKSIPARRISLSRGAFAEKVRLMLYAPEVSRFLPLLVHLAASGDFRPFAELADEMGQQIAGLASVGMYLSVTCTEDVARITPAEAANTWPVTFLGDYRVRQQRAACALWPKGGLSADFSAPIRAGAPVLLISSTIDPITPPRWADEVARGLPNNRHIRVPNAGHSPSSQCVMAIESQFIETASPAGLDVQCLGTSRQPPFALELPR